MELEDEDAKVFLGHVVYRDGKVYRPERSVRRSDGVVRTLRGGWVSSRVSRAPKGSGGGYVYISIGVQKDDGTLEKQDWLLHRLVASAFIPNPQGKPDVNHKDGNRANNCEGNLEWATRSENQSHAYRTGLRTDVRLVAGKHIGEAGRQLGGNTRLVADRIDRLGWDENRAVATPAFPKKRIRVVIDGVTHTPASIQRAFGVPRKKFKRWIDQHGVEYAVTKLTGA